MFKRALKMQAFKALFNMRHFNDSFVKWWKFFYNVFRRVTWTVGEQKRFGRSDDHKTVPGLGPLAAERGVYRLCYRRFHFSVVPLRGLETALKLWLSDAELWSTVLGQPRSAEVSEGNGSSWGGSSSFLSRGGVIFGIDPSQVLQGELPHERDQRNPKENTVKGIKESGCPASSG